MDTRHACDKSYINRVHEEYGTNNVYHSYQILILAIMDTMTVYVFYPRTVSVMFPSWVHVVPSYHVLFPRPMQCQVILFMEEHRVLTLRCSVQVDQYSIFPFSIFLWLQQFVSCPTNFLAKAAGLLSLRNSLHYLNTSRGCR